MTTNRKFYVVVAKDLKNGIGYAKSLPWPRLHTDLKFLREKTSHTEDKTATQVDFDPPPPDKQNAVIMGRITWEGLPKTIRPLSNRYNIVLSSRKREEIPNAHMVCPSLNAALEALQNQPLSDKIESVFVLGGSEVFKEAMCSELCEKLFVTEILAEFPTDTHFPPIDSSVYKLLEGDGDPLAPRGVIEENGVKFKFTVYQRQK